jgi:hypothetical protein
MGKFEVSINSTRVKHWMGVDDLEGLEVLADEGLLQLTSKAPRLERFVLERE